MPGINRPYTLRDVLGAINDQLGAQQQAATSITGLGYFGEADETLTSTDAVTGYVTAPFGWDGGTWGAIVWQ